MAWLSDALSFVAIRRTPRVAQRRVTFLNAKLRSGNVWRNVQIGNISTWGLMLRAEEPPELGEVIEVRHRGWSAAGEVVWKSGSRVGVKVSAPIDANELFERCEIGRQEPSAIRPAKRPRLNFLRQN